MDTTRLYFVRHGATQLTAEDRFSGAVGVDLSDEGRWQVKRLSERLRDDQICAVYRSPLGRTVETAQILAAPHKLDLVKRDGLREISHGRWEGLTRREVEERFGDEYAQWEADPFTFAPEGGESGLAVLARALPVVREIVVRHPGERVLVVSHKATLRLALSSLVGIDARGYRDRLDQSPACLNVVDFKDPVHARLMLFNDVSHYADAPRRVGNNLSKWWDEGAEGPEKEESWRTVGEPTVYMIRGTRKLLARLGVPVSTTPHSPTTALGDWYGNILRFGSRQLVLCTSEPTLLCVVLPARGLKLHLSMALSDGLASLLAALEVPKPQIDHELAEMRQHAVAGTQNRSVLGSMNDFAVAVSYRMHGREGLPLLDLALELAQTPCSPLGYDRPANVARRMLASVKERVVQQRDQSGQARES